MYICMYACVYMMGEDGRQGGQRKARKADR